MRHQVLIEGARNRLEQFTPIGCGRGDVEIVLGSFGRRHGMKGNDEAVAELKQIRLVADVEAEGSGPEAGGELEFGVVVGGGGSGAGIEEGHNQASAVLL